MDLQQLIALLSSHDELTRITVETDPFLEISAITSRICSSRGNTALLFQRPQGCSFPVATNLFGTIRRLCLALGVSNLEHPAQRLESLLNLIASPRLVDLDHRMNGLSAFQAYAPSCSEDALTDYIQQPVPDLTLFPFLQSWPDDGSAEGFGCYITLPLVFTVDPVDGTRNCGMYRAQVRGKDALAIRWKPGSGADSHHQAYRRQGRAMPVALALGGDPAATFAAMCPLPGELDEMTFAGLLRGEALRMVPCRSVPLQVPAGCELVIEGFVDPDDTVVEGPFGNHTGCYSPAGPAALMRITSIWHRPECIVPATVVGPPPMEDCWMARIWERMLLRFLRCLIPAVRDICFPLEWVFHQSAVISLENPSPGMVRETAEILWKTPWFSAARLLIFVGAEAETAAMSSIAWRCINFSEFSQDIFCDRSGNRFALDATGRRCHSRQLDNSGIAQRVASRWKEYGF